MKRNTDNYDFKDAKLLSLRVCLSKVYSVLEWLILKIIRIQKNLSPIVMPLIAIITDKQKSIKFRMTISQGNNSEKKTKTRPRLKNMYNNKKGFQIILLE